MSENKKETLREDIKDFGSSEIKNSKGSISEQEYYIISEGDDSSFSVKEKHSNEPVTEKAEPDIIATASAAPVRRRKMVLCLKVCFPLRTVPKDES